MERVIESTLETLAARTTSYSHLHSVAEGMPFNRNDCVCMTNAGVYVPERWEYLLARINVSTRPYTAFGAHVYAYTIYYIHIYRDDFANARYVTHRENKKPTCSKKSFVQIIGHVYLCGFIVPMNIYMQFNIDLF